MGYPGEHNVITFIRSGQEGQEREEAVKLEAEVRVGRIISYEMQWRLDLANGKETFSPGTSRKKLQPL